MSQTTSEAAQHADFSQIRYAQVWEDADILVEGLRIGQGDCCLSIASAGDNALALLAKNPDRVVAVDLNPAQLACLELRVAAFRRLEYTELLSFLGSRPSENRGEVYRLLRTELSQPVRAFWDAKPEDIAQGVAHAGKFENYFRLFRQVALPLVHSRTRISALFEPRSLEQRREFYERHWNNLRWNLLFRIFFSRFTMGALGRDPSFFRYVEGPVAEAILKRAKHALTELAPHENPYLHWILFGRHSEALPFYLREEHFKTIRANLERFEWHEASVEDFLGRGDRFSKWNLSDIFEYMSQENTTALLEKIADSSPPGARLAYWNMLAPRRSPPELAPKIRFLEAESRRLHLADKAFFYSAFVLEEVV